MGRGVEREGRREDGGQKWGAPIHSQAGTRSVVVWVPMRMINEAFQGQRKFLSCGE